MPISSSSKTESRHWKKLSIRPRRNRQRVGSKVEVAGGVEAGLRMASGGSDPRSTNQTLDNFFDTKDFRLDQAYLKWKPLDSMSLVGGKFDNPLWTPSDLLWDSDITPEGAAAKLAFGPFFANMGFFVLDEHSGDSNDPFMVTFQPGAKFDVGMVDFKLAATGYWFSDITKSPLEFSADTNTRKDDGSDTLLYEYNSVSVGAEVGVNLEGFVERVALFGEGIYNPDPDEDEYGWLGGLKFGSKKVDEFGKWEAKYSYRRLEKDAWLDTFPDSDFFGGATGVQGHEGIISFGLTRHFTLDIDYYHVEEIEDSDQDQQLLQLDFVAKF
ncbi:MAG: putative porin [Deltaproteobacteria bacterium]|nr:putative porin [Deltaproteobacteria bacterium]